MPCRSGAALRSQVMSWLSPKKAIRVQERLMNARLPQKSRRTQKPPPRTLPPRMLGPTTTKAVFQIVMTGNVLGGRVQPPSMEQRANVP